MNKLQVIAMLEEMLVKLKEPTITYSYPIREPLSYTEHMKLWDDADGSKGLFHKIHEYGILIEKTHGVGNDI